jgi:hypothetical protein
MCDALTIVLLLATGLLLVLVIMFTSSGLFGYYIVETVRRILRTRRTKLEP